MIRALGPAILAVALAVWPAPGAAGPAETARAAALDLLNAIDALAEARQARDRVAALSRTIHAQEQGLGALRAGLRQAALREAAIQREFDLRAAELSQLLAAMMAVERIEGPALLIHPQGPLGTARAGMMMADLAPAMQAQADRIGAELRELRDLRSVRQAAVDTLALGLTMLQEARTELSQAIADRRDLPPRIAEDDVRMMELLAAARTLDEFAAGLAGAPPGLFDALPPFETTRGRLPLPVVGRVIRRAGEADAAGVVRPGLLLGTEGGALVRAPWPGSIRYRGPLLDYGNVILLEPAEDYLIVMAGLDAVYPRPGEVVGDGAALGLMPGAVVGADEFVSTSTVAQGGETLYLELRHRGAPIDPAQWFDMTGQ